MDKDNLDFESVVAHFKKKSLPSVQKDLPPTLWVALFFMAVGLILVATGLISVLLRLPRLMQLPARWLIQRMQFFRSINTKLLRRVKHSS